MDFILLPDNVSAHDVIPDLGGPEYDNKGFQGYPGRQGWNVQALRRGDISSACDKWGVWATGALGEVASDDEYTYEQVARVIGAFAQRWILFGILQEALRRPLRHDEIVKTSIGAGSDGQIGHANYITLRSLFTEFVGKKKQIEADVAWTDHLLQCLREAAGLLADLGFRGAKLGLYLIPVPIHFALSTFVDSLDFNLDRDGGMTAPGRVFPGRSMAFEQNLRQNHGWCPNMIRRTLMTVGHEGLYYASLMPKVETGKDHKTCTEDVCLASNIDNNNYEIMHVAKACTCEVERCDHKQLVCPCPFLDVQERELAVAHEGDGFPLVRLKNNELEAVRYQPGMAYIAISHVWSDGKGNPLRNALPLCQLAVIDRYITELNGIENSLFWMDTLCVPLKEPVRNTAIMRMAAIYSSATQVLVLSAELLENRLPSTPDEAFLRIFCSQWSARLWTMQEATLATKLVFQFADRAISYDNLYMLMTMEAFTNLDGRSRQFGTRANLAIEDIRSITLATGQEEQTFPIERFWSSLRFRSTSRPSDVAICGSILLKYGLETVLSVPDDRKMQVFWLSQHTVPASVLWSNGPRFNTEGLRWAPSNLLNPKTATWTDGDVPPAIPAQDGLQVSGVEAVLLENVPLPERENFRLRYSLRSKMQRYVFFKTCDVGNDTWTEMRDFWTGQCVILFGPVRQNQWHGFAALIMPTSLGFADSLSDETHSRSISARYLAQITVLVQGGMSDSDTITVNDGNDAIRSAILLNSGTILDIGEGREINSSQRWLIS